MQLALLPVVEDLLGEEFGAATVEEVVENAEEEEGALEEEVDVGPVNGGGIFRMLLPNLRRSLLEVVGIVVLGSF